MIEEAIDKAIDMLDTQFDSIDMPIDASMLDEIRDLLQEHLYKEYTGQ